MSRLKFPKRLLLTLLAALVLTFLAVWIWVGSVERHLRAQVEGRVQELEAEILARSPRRPVLIGEAIPGDAWEDYGPALAAVHALPKESLRTLADRAYSGDGTPAQMAALELIKKGLSVGSRRAEARISLEHLPTVDNTFETDNLYGSAAVAGQAAARAGSRLMEDGFPREGADLLLTAAQFGRDLASHPDFLGWRLGTSVLHVVLEQLTPLLQAGRVPPSEAASIAAALRILDETWKSYDDDGSRDLLHWGRRVLKGLPGEENTRSATSPTWKQAYSRSIMEFTAFLDYDQAFHRRPTHLSLPHLEANAEFLILLDEVAARGNPAATFMNSGVCSHRVIRENLAKLRLTRVAAHYSATSEVLDLADPMGERIRTAIQGRELVIWSVWRDGVDDGGNDRPDKDRVVRVPLIEGR